MYAFSRTQISAPDSYISLGMWEWVCGENRMLQMERGHGSGREVEVVKLICGAGKEKGKYWAYKWRWWSEDGEEDEPTKLCMK